MLIYIIISVVIISLVSLIGILTLFFRKNLNKILLVLVAFAAGSLLASVFFELLLETDKFNFVLLGIVGFFLLESGIHWHHNHKAECEKCIHPVAFLNLFGDGLHNFLDGIIIAAGFLLSISSGVIVSLAMLFHEIPQELGDFGVLVKSGLSRKKALLFNLLSASLALVGGIAGYLFLSRIDRIIPYVIALAAGGFLYIAGADLIPELHKEKDKKKMIIQILSLIFGIMIILLILRVFPE